MSYISKKESKRISKIISDKLKLMGVKDEITFIGSGKKKKFYKKDDSGGVIMEKNDRGELVPKVFEVEMPIAMNVLRRTVRELRKAPVEVINAFLRMPVTSPSEQNGPI
jgi:hypothetical protein